MSTKQRSKRKTKVPIKFKDTVCDLKKNVDKNNDESNDDSKSEKAEVNSVNGESGDDNISLRSETNSYATEFPLLTKVNMLNKEDCNSKVLDMKIEEDDNNYVHEGKRMQQSETKICWKPPKCNECKVFGHTEKTCGSKCGNENRTESSVWDKENNQVEDGYRKVSYGNKNKQPAPKMSKGLGHGNTKGIKAKTRV
ncbi:hypothetical protein Tco_1014868 [Tanacetum coccineum]